MLNIRAKFRGDMTSGMPCAKKTNPWSKCNFKNILFRALILLFLHRAEYMTFHHETLHVFRKHVYVHDQKNS